MYQCPNCNHMGPFRIFLSSGDVDKNGNVVKNCPRDHVLIQCLSPDEGCSMAGTPVQFTVPKEG